MAAINLIGSGYEGRSKNINASRCVNFYPEINSPESKSVVSLVGIPGTSYFTNVVDGIVRGMHVFNDLIYVVSSNKLYSVDINGVRSSQLGNDLNTSIGRLQFSDNGLSPTGGNQLIISDGTKLYCYNVLTDTFTTQDLTSSTNCFLGGYFIADVGGGQFQSSALYDGSSWNSINKATAEAEPDDLVCVYNNHGELWLFGNYTTEIWYQKATGSPPFERITGGVIDYGCAAKHSVAKGSNTIFWLGNNRNGNQGQFKSVFMAVGYDAKPISTPSIDYTIDNYTTIEDAFAYFYTEEGHEFYVLTFPSANATWTYDTTTGYWHERSTYENNPYNVGRHVGNCYCHYRNRHFLGDYKSSNILELKSDVYKDQEKPIVSFRTSQPIFDKNNLENVFISKIQIDAETGKEQEKITTYEQGNIVSLSETSGCYAVYSVMYGNGYFWVNGLEGYTSRRIFKVNETTGVVDSILNAQTGSVQKIYYDSNARKFYIIQDSTHILSVYNEEMTLLDSDNSRTFNNDDQIESIGDYLYITDYDNNRLEKILKSDLVRDSYADLGGTPLYIANNGFNKVWVLLDGGTIKTVNIQDMSVSTLATGIDYYVGVGGSKFLYNIFVYFKNSLWCVGDDIQKINIITGAIDFSLSRADLTASKIPEITFLDNEVYVLNAVSSDYDILKIDVSDYEIKQIKYSVDKISDPLAAVNKIFYVDESDSFDIKSSLLTKDYENKDDKISLSWSNDGGHTWSNERQSSLGNIGEYTKRLIWRRLGYSKSKVFRITISSPIKKVLINQYIE